MAAIEALVQGRLVNELVKLIKLELDGVNGLPHGLKQDMLVITAVTMTRRGSKDAPPST